MSGLCLLTWKKWYGFCTRMYFSYPFSEPGYCLLVMYILECVSEDNNYFHFLFIWPCHELSIILYFVSYSYACKRTTETIPSTTFVTVSACLRWCMVWSTCVSFGIIWQGRSWESYWLQQCVTIWTTLAITIRTYNKTRHNCNGKLFIQAWKDTQARETLS